MVLNSDSVGDEGGCLGAVIVTRQSAPFPVERTRPLPPEVSGIVNEHNPSK